MYKGVRSVKNQENCSEIRIPDGKLCGHNCSDGCIYWNPYDRDSNGRQWCSYYSSYYYPRERQGCLSYKG